LILTCTNVKKSFGAQDLLSDVCFNLEEGGKCGIVGVNGAGKTTLFKIITGEEEADGGEVAIKSGARIGYLSQAMSFMNPENTVYEELKNVFSDLDMLEANIRETEVNMASLEGEQLEKTLSKYNTLVTQFEARNGYERESRLKGVIKGLSFDAEELELPVKLLSGGRKTRASLGKLLLSAPDLLLLDEPTNHLDISSVSWFEDTFIKNYPGAVLIISHDRYFLDKTVKKIVEIEYAKAKTYNGNYTFYALKKEADRAVLLHQYASQQKEIERQEGIIKQLKSFNREKFVKRAESREKLLAKVERIDKPANDPQKMRFVLEPAIESGNDVLSSRDVSKNFDDTVIFENVNFEIKKGDIVALIGENGIGKSTILKMIYGGLGYSGRISLGTNVNVGFYDQEHVLLDSSKTIFQEMADSFPRLANVRIRTILASFMFKGDDVFKSIGNLSGGEKGRVALAKLMLGNVNFILLDEPTNHLDMFSKEVLEQALRSYTGTVLYVSHDRYFINNTAEKVIELTENGSRLYLGNYDNYLEAKANGAAEPGSVGRSPVQSGISLSTGSSDRIDNTKLDYKSRKEAEAAARKQEARIKRIEEGIQKLETDIQMIDNWLLSPEAAKDPEKVMQEYEKKAALEEQLGKLYDEWEEVQ